MTPTARTACALGGCVAVAAVLAFGSADQIAFGQTSRPAAKSPASPPANSTASPPANSPALEQLRQRGQELDSARSEQRKSSETEHRLTTENDSIAEERRKLNQALLDAAARIRGNEERVAATEIHLRLLETGESDMRRSLEGRRAVIAEVLAALQRIGHRPPPAVFAASEDAIESIRTAMSLGAVLPQMRGEADKLLVELADLSRVKKEKVNERNQLAGQLAELADAQKSMAALIEDRQKQPEVTLIRLAGRQQLLRNLRQIIQRHCRAVIRQQSLAVSGTIQRHKFAGLPGDHQDLVCGSVMIDEESLFALAHRQMGSFAGLRCQALHVIVTEGDQHFAPVLIARDPPD